jgi:hypothetical protein
MNKKTGANRGLPRAGALALVAAVAVLSTACGGASHPSSASSGPGDPTHAQAQQEQQQKQQEQQLQKAELATLSKFSHCMQGHGVANWPDPILTSQGISMNLKTAGINTDSPQVQAAYSACQHVAPGLQLHVSIKRSHRAS